MSDKNENSFFFLDIPFATCAGIGDGHDGRVLLIFERALGVPTAADDVLVVDRGRSKEEQR